MSIPATIKAITMSSYYPFSYIIALVSMIWEYVVRVFKRGASPSFLKILPLPCQGRGTQGVGHHIEIAFLPRRRYNGMVCPKIKKTGTP
jgi:hypothetical protein